MLQKLKQVLKNKFFIKDNNHNSREMEINFPGGITPISETKPEDVFIVGFPKSGNTLMQHIIAHLYYGLNEEGSRSMVNLIAPDVYANSHYFRFNKVCFFKSHERPQPNYKKVIYMLRDGREALLSYYYMVQNMGQDISLEDLYTGKINIYGGLWHEHVEAWEKNPYQADILWLKFEDIINNKLHVLKQICHFLEMERSNEELEKVMRLTSFDHMKSLEVRSDWKKMKMANFKEGKPFLRSGKINSYRAEVSEQLLAEFESQNQTIIKKYYR